MPLIAAPSIMTTLTAGKTSRQQDRSGGRSFLRHHHAHSQNRPDTISMSSGTDDNSSGGADPFSDDAAASDDEGDEEGGENEAADQGCCTSVFQPSLQLQIETPGKALLSKPGPGNAEPIPIYVVGEEGEEAFGAQRQQKQQPAFISMRKSRRSGNSVLVAGGAPWRSAVATAASDGDGANGSPVSLQTLSTTTYKFGPGRNPQVCLLGPETGEDGDTFEIRRRQMFKRAQGFRTRLGTFEWRYGSRAERRSVTAARRDSGSNSSSGSSGGTEREKEKEKENDEEVDSLLVLDRVVKVYLPSSTALPLTVSTTTTTFSTPSTIATAMTTTETEIRRPVARLIRSAALRSRGSTGTSAGNGGRLQLDRDWLMDEALTAGERDSSVVLAVTTCLVMLKKEVDRRRGKQMAVMAGVIGSG